MHNRDNQSLSIIIIESSLPHFSNSESTFNTCLMLAKEASMFRSLQGHERLMMSINVT